MRRKSLAASGAANVADPRPEASEGTSSSCFLQIPPTVVSLELKKGKLFQPYACFADLHLPRGFFGHKQAGSPKPG